MKYNLFLEQKSRCEKCQKFHKVFDIFFYICFFFCDKCQKSIGKKCIINKELTYYLL